jgi:outer membrane protein TolC
VDVHLIRANGGNARSNLEFRRQQLDAATRILEVLLGRYPAKEVEAVQTLSPLGLFTRSDRVGKTRG